MLEMAEMKADGIAFFGWGSLGLTGEPRKSP